MKHKYVIIAILVSNLSISSFADLLWFNSEPILDFDGNAVLSSQTDSSVGYFAQLIFAGASAPSAFVNAGSGVSGDDVVVDTMFAGMNDFLATDGFFPLQNTPAVQGSANNGNYYVRVFDAPNLDFNLGTSAPIPSAANYFWQSEVHTFVHSDFEPDNWDFAPSGGQTFELIPEPSAMALLFIGGGSLMYFRRRLRA